MDVSNAGFGAVDDASWTTVYEGFVDGRGRTAVATTEADASPACARAWAREILRASGVVSGDGTVSKTSDVLIVTSCSEHETSEAEMSLGAIDAVTAYGLDTTALRVVAADVAVAASLVTGGGVVAIERRVGAVERV